MSFYSLPDRQHAILNMIIQFFLWDVEMGNEILMRIWTWVHMQPALFDSFLRKGLKLF